MSERLESPGRVGQVGGDNAAGLASKSAGIERSMRWCLTSGTSNPRRTGVKPAGIAHTLTVCVLEMEIMARGGKARGDTVAGGGMPRFVDVRLTPEQRVEFTRQILSDSEAVEALRRLTDDGYRVGVSWSGDSQSYTVSLTGRDTSSPNNGLCMTSFAKDLRTAVSLAVYKHFYVCGERWVPEESAALGDFG